MICKQIMLWGTYTPLAAISPNEGVEDGWSRISLLLYFKIFVVICQEFHESVRVTDLRISKLSIISLVAYIKFPTGFVFGLHVS